MVTTVVGELKLDQMHPTVGFGLVKQPPAWSDGMEVRCQKAHLRELDHVVGGMLVGLHPRLYVCWTSAKREQAVGMRNTIHHDWSKEL